jgi:hypothetical protein
MLLVNEENGKEYQPGGSITTEGEAGRVLLTTGGTESHRGRESARFSLCPLWLMNFRHHLKLT